MIIPLAAKHCKRHRQRTRSVYRWLTLLCPILQALAALAGLLHLGVRP